MVSQNKNIGNGTRVQFLNDITRVSSYPDSTSGDGHSGFLYLSSNAVDRIGRASPLSFDTQLVTGGGNVRLDIDSGTGVATVGSGLTPYVQPLVVRFNKVTSGETNVYLGFANDNSIQFANSSFVFDETDETSAELFTCLSTGTSGETYLTNQFGFFVSFGSGTSIELNPLNLNAIPFEFKAYEYTEDTQLLATSLALYNRWPTRITLVFADVEGIEDSGTYKLQAAVGTTTYLHAYFITVYETGIARGALRVDVNGTTTNFNNWLSWDGTSLVVPGSSTTTSENNVTLWSLYYDSAVSDHVLQFDGPTVLASSFSEGGGFLSSTMTFTTDYSTTPFAITIYSGFVDSSTTATLGLNEIENVKLLINPSKVMSSVVQAELYGNNGILTEPNSSGGITIGKYAMTSCIGNRLNGEVYTDTDCFYTNLNINAALFSAEQLTNIFYYNTSNGELSPGEYIITVPDETASSQYLTLEDFNEELRTGLDPSSFVFSDAGNNFLDLIITTNILQGDFTLDFQRNNFAMMAVMGFSTNESVTVTYPNTLTVRGNEVSQFFDTRYGFSTGARIPYNFMCPRSGAFDFVLPADRPTSFTRYPRMISLREAVSSRLTICGCTRSGSTLVNTDAVAFRVATIERDDQWT